MSGVTTTRSTVDLVSELARYEVIVCCGSGGVGKTTVSAALGMGLATGQEKRVLVLTIDPARRLATALGLSSIGTEPTSIPLKATVYDFVLPIGPGHCRTAFALQDFKKWGEGEYLK